MLLTRFRIILTLIATLVCTETYAQNIEAMRSNLSSRAIDGSHVRVTEDGSSKEAIAAVEQQRRVSQVSGFRIVIFSDNGQYAGDTAKEVLNDFRSSFPHINAYLVYESPYFKVSVGDCLTMEEAQILMAELSSAYPKAYPKREVIELTELQRVRAKGNIAADSTSLATGAEAVAEYSQH